MQVFVLAILFACLQASFAQEWETGTLNKYTSLLGVYARTPSEIYGSVLDNTVGNGVLLSQDYATTGTFYGPAGAMNMDVAVSHDNQTVALVGVGGIFLGPPSSASFTKVDGIRLISQNVEPFGDSGFAVTGQLAVGRNDYNGATISADGKTWTQSDIGLDAALYPARYGAFPSENTWFVSAGTWPMTASAGLGRRLTERLSINEEQAVPSYTYTPKNLRENLVNFGVKKNTMNDEATGYTGAIAKTTDAGKTWSTVFSTGDFYFNKISCHCEKHCVAVGENDDTGFAVYTSNGGENWSTVFSGPPGLSLASAAMIDGKEFWISGGLQQRGALMGYYYHTTDAGMSWTLYTSNGYSFDMSFSGEVGYSTFLTQSYSSVAVYNKPK
jgi:hypothetical protein